VYYHPGTVDAAEQTTELAADTLRAWALDEDLKRRVRSTPRLARLAAAVASDAAGPVGSFAWRGCASAGGAGWLWRGACAGSDASVPARPGRREQRAGIADRVGLPPVLGGQVLTKG